MAIDYINTLGAGAGFNTKEVVSALVEAETSGRRDRLEKRVDDNNAEISALADAAASFSLLQAKAQGLNDAREFTSFTTSNSQSTAFSITASSEAKAGSHNVSVSAIAREQRTNITAHGGVDFSSATQTLNSGTAFSIALEVGSSSTVTTNISVANATPQGIVDAVNAADLDITAQLIDKGTTGTNLIIQLVGKSGTEGQFTITPSVNSLLNTNTPNGETASNASLTVNGVTYSRSSNTVDDVIPGATLKLNSVTSGTASVTVETNTSALKTNIEGFIDQFNATKDTFDALSSRELDGALAGDSIFRGKVREIKGFFTAFSSTPGAKVRGLSDMGISITRVGELEINATKLDSALATNLADVTKIFSANTNDQSELGAADRGIAGDVSKFITDLTSSAGYLSIRPESLDLENERHREDLAELELRVQSLTERYTKQFATMNSLVNEMNNTKESLISSFENLPFTSRDN